MTVSNRLGSLKSRALMTTSAAALGLALASSFGGAAWAQSSDTGAAAQEIVVTGSRIARRDYSSNSPIVTLNSETFENTANVAVEATLNKLPQFAPDQNLMGLSAADVQPSPTHTVGISTASLRNLGANRNLVLVDGRRLTPVNGLMVIDLNSIPSAMIDHVETITGGASAVYGPDAVSGVVNFILKKNYQGVTMSAQYGETVENNDDQEFRLSALMGTNFADDRGNVTFGLEHYTRGQALYNKREFYRKGWADPTVGAGNAFATGQGFYDVQPQVSFVIPFGAGGVNFNAAPFNWHGPTDPNGLLEDRWANYSAVYDSNAPGATQLAAGSLAYGGVYWPAPPPNMFFNNDGTIYPMSQYDRPVVLGPNGQVDGQSAYQGTVDGYNVAYVHEYDTVVYNVLYQDPGGNQAATSALRAAAGPPPTYNFIKFNDTNGQLLAPLKRWSSFASGHYDLDDNLSVFFQANYSTDTTQTNTAPPVLSEAIGGGTDTLIPSPTDASTGTFFFTGGSQNTGRSLGTGHQIQGCAPGSAAAASTKTCTAALQTLGIHFPVPNQLGILLANRYYQFPAASAVTGAPAGAVWASPLQSDPVAQAWDLSFQPPPDGSIFPRRTVTNRLTNYQFTSGFDGKLPSIDWTWELFASYGESTSYNNSPKNIDLQRLRALLLYTGLDNNQPGAVASVWGKGAVITGNQINTRSPGSNTSTVTCTSGFYDTIFHNQAPSQDCLDAVLVDLQTMSTMTQNVVEFDAQGHLFDLPAGEVRASVGASYRDDTLNYQPDSLQLNNSFIDQPAGADPIGGTTGSISAREGYGELLVPVLKDLPLIRHFNLELGGRYSTYTNSPAGWTYKALADWQVFDWMRLRGGYNLAVRAPSVGETYQARAALAQVTTDTDPCTLASTSPIGAGGADNPMLRWFANVAPGIKTLINTTADNLDPALGGQLYNSDGLKGAQNTFAICRAQMGVPADQVVAAGVSPLTPADYGMGTGVGTATPGFGAVGGAAYFFYQTNPGHSWYSFDGAPAHIYKQGSTHLGPEIGKTWTAGMVLNSPFKTPWLQRGTLSFDWYSILLNHTIGFPSLTQVATDCYTQNVLTPDGSGIDLTLLQQALNSFSCSELVSRNQTTGNWDSVIEAYNNQGYQKVSGVDAQMNWGAEFADVGLDMIPGSFNVNVVANYMLHFITNPNPHDPSQTFLDYAGTLATTGQYPGAYFRYQTNATFTYIIGPATFSLNWRHLPTIRIFGKTQRKTFDQVCAAGGAPSFCPAPNSDADFNAFLPIDPASHDEFNFATSYALSDKITVRGGIDNLLDAQPEVTGGVRGAFAPESGVWTLTTTGNGSTNANVYDTLGRRFYFSITGKF